MVYECCSTNSILKWIKNKYEIFWQDKVEDKFQFNISKLVTIQQA